MLLQLGQWFSTVNQRAFILAGHHALERTGLDNGKHPDRQLLIAAQGKGRCVHDAQIARHGFVKCQLVIADGAGVFAGVGRINAIYLGG